MILIGTWPFEADFCVSGQGVVFRHVTAGHVSNKRVWFREGDGFNRDLAL